MDTTQLLLTIVLSLTTLLLLIVGVQLIFILVELRKSLRKINKVIEGYESLGNGLDQSMNEVVGFINGFKTVLKTIELVHKKK